MQLKILHTNVSLAHILCLTLTRKNGVISSSGVQIFANNSALQALGPIISGLPLSAILSLTERIQAASSAC